MKPVIAQRWIPLFVLLAVLLIGGGLIGAPAAGAPDPLGRASAPAAPPLLPTATPTLTPPPLAGCWTAMSTEQQEVDDLVALAAIGPDDIWTVGAGFGNGTYPVAQHWDGTTWTNNTPAIGGEGRLSGVAASASNDVWAVGKTLAGVTVIAHWDGSAWTYGQYASTPTLVALAARAPNDAWAVGSTILHWDGTAWTPVPASTIGFRLSVTALAANDAWAVGYNGTSHTLTEHWDGTAWTQVPSPNLGPGENNLTGVSALAPNDVWASGWYDNAGVRQTLIEHWDGTAWTILPSPNLGSGNNQLGGIVALAPNDVWAAGYYAGFSDDQTLILHWDGTVWSVAPSPNLGGDNNHLNAIAATGANDIWAIGSYTVIYDGVGLALHYSAPCVPPPPTCPPGFSIVPSPGNGSLKAIAAVNANDIWAVGTQIDHWDGSYWLQVPGPSSPPLGILNGITALSTNNVWAVGSYDDDTTAILHWDGTTWTPVPSPSVGVLNGVAAVAPNDIWAVGSHILHWDGTAWSSVPAPNTDPLYGVTAIAANDVWAVGRQILHWDGTTWSGGPAPFNTYNLYSISAVAADDIWAVGWFGVTLHWDGTAWTQVPTAVGFALYGVYARATDDVWAVGATTSSSHRYPIAEHWDGSAWYPVDTPAWGGRWHNLFAVTAPDPGDTWAVGEETDDTLIEHYPATCATPTPTQTPGLPPTATPTPPCQAAWLTVNSPSLSGVNTLRGVAGTGPADIWAVGDVSHSNGQFATLTEHWDGAAWSIVPSPNVGTDNTRLYGVTALAPNDVWAVGDEVWWSGGPWTHTVAMHWDGTQWTMIPSPNPGSNDSLYAIAAVSPTDIWAVGHNDEHVLTAHWDGTQWSRVIVPVDGALYGLTVLGPNNVWAVGRRSAYNVPDETLILHWDGLAWNEVPAPNMNGLNNVLNGVAALAADDIWAVGTTRPGNGVLHTLALHWDGTQWSLVPSPNIGWGNNTFAGMAAAPGRGVWAGGQYTDGNNVTHSLVRHWDGQQWAGEPSPPMGRFAAIALIGGRGWAVGTNNGTLTARYQNLCGSSTPSPTPIITLSATPTHPPAPPTPTGSPPAGSATPTPPPTACAGAFVDVPPGSTFYDYVHCLACRGIVGGYPCGGPGEPCPGAYYRPNNNVTRGQTAKIVSTSAAFADPIPSGQQTFEDVTPGSTFALWVERLAGRGILGGYPCGGASEPCVAPGNRPYFRPNNNVTRGQLAKITSGAAGYTATPTGQTFEDVPPASTFYLWVERLLRRGIIGGYPCGSAGEPCVAPANRPYFRPNNPATRGQMSKIAAAAFFPNCTTPVRR